MMSSCYSKLHFMLQLGTLTDILTLNFQKFCIPYYKITETFYYFFAFFTTYPCLHDCGHTQLILNIHQGNPYLILTRLYLLVYASCRFLFSTFFALQDNTPQEILLRNLKSPQPDFSLLSVPKAVLY